MKAKGLLAALAMVGLLTAGGNAMAKNMDGHFGVGVNQSLNASVTGIGLNYWIGNIKAGIIAGVNYFKPDSGDGQMQVRLALQGLYAVARATNANLNVGLRFNLGMNSKVAPDTTGFGFEIPIEAEYFLSDHFSILGHAGLAIDIIGKDGSPLMPGAGKGLNIGFGSAGFSGGVGFNFWF